MGYRVINGKLISVLPIASPKTKEKIQVSESDNFAGILKKQVDKKQTFIISSHAAQRLNSRNINLDEADMIKINEGINKADAKGARESLILYKDLALVTSIKNRTVITAVDKNKEGDNVFTNIDSVVLL
jgi:flagellar operon protein